MDEDIDGTSGDDLAAEVRRLRSGIRTHRDSSGHDLCWHHPDLWGLLPERQDPLPVVPDWPEFLRGCVQYRESLDRQQKERSTMMNTAGENSAESNAAQVRSLVEARARAVRASHRPSLRAANASRIVTFDVLPPLVNTGADRVDERTQRWLGSYDSPPGYDVRDLEVVASDSVALAFYLYRVSGTLKDGRAVDMWVRCTLGLQKLDGAWRIVHEHDSVPFDPETGRAVLDAQPESPPRT